MKRRQFLKRTMAGSVVATVGSGLLVSPAFANTDKFKALSDQVRSNIASASDGDFKLKVPTVAENGAVVPMEVDARKINGVTNISLYVTENATPLVASFNFSGSEGYVNTRVKMAKTSDVVALVTAGERTYKVVKPVRVTIGGCGG